MDKIQKFIRRATKEERSHIARVVSQLELNTTKGLDIKKLKGFADVYRVRIGDIRLIYRKLTQGIAVLSISRRDNHTYRDF